MGAQNTSLQDRLNFMEKFVGDSVEMNAEEIATAHAKLELIIGRLSVCEKDCMMSEDLRKAHADIVENKEMEGLKALQLENANELLDLKARVACSAEELEDLR